MANDFMRNVNKVSLDGEVVSFSNTLPIVDVKVKEVVTETPIVESKKRSRKANKEEKIEETVVETKEEEKEIDESEDEETTEETTEEIDEE